MFIITEVFKYDGSYRNFSMFEDKPNGCYKMFVVFDRTDGNFTYLTENEVKQYLLSGVQIRDTYINDNGEVQCMRSPTSVYLDNVKNFYNNKPLSDFRLIIGADVAHVLASDSEDVVGVIVDARTGKFIIGCNVVYLGNEIEYIEPFNAGVAINFRGNQLSQFVIHRRSY